MRFAIIAAMLGVLGFVNTASAQVRVEGYTRKDGTYVAPHYRSSPNDTKMDNWSTRGNTNPYTGQPGTRDPYGNSYGTSPYGNNSYGSNPYGNNPYGTQGQQRRY